MIGTRVTIALVSVAVLSACGPPSVSVGAGWPKDPPDYDDTYEEWTRHDRAFHDGDTAIDVYATLLSPEWRAAYVATKAREGRLGREAHTALLSQEHQLANEFWEVELLVSTYQYQANDLARDKNSMWRIVLIGDGGREVAPIDVRSDNRPKVEVQRWFPRMTPFHKAYVVRFPKNGTDGAPLVGPSSPRLALKVGSSIAAVTFVWEK